MLNAYINGSGNGGFAYVFTQGMRDTQSTGPYINMQSSTSGVLINTRDAANKGLVIQGAASQTANLQEWQDSSGTVLAKVDANGTIQSQYFTNRTNVSNAYIGWVSDTLLITNRTASSVPFAIQGAASQSASLTVWQNSSANALACARSGVLVSNQSKSAYSA